MEIPPPFYRAGAFSCAPRLAGEITRVHRDSDTRQDNAQDAIPTQLLHGHFTAMLEQVEALRVDENAWAGTGHGPEGTLAMRVTPREREIIRGLVCYRRLSTVASILGISVHTARNHLKSIFRKLNLHSQDELLQFLLEGDGA